MALKFRCRDNSQDSFNAQLCIHVGVAEARGGQKGLPPPIFPGILLLLLLFFN